MGNRGREAAAKRARERARQEKQAAKRERRQSRDTETPESSVDEARLMEEFAELSARHEANQISDAEYEEHRHRIFSELGIETT